MTFEDWVIKLQDWPVIEINDLTREAQITAVSCQLRHVGDARKAARVFIRWLRYTQYLCESKGIY